MNKIDVDKAVGIIKKEGVVIFPTDTVYGIGASIKSEEAVQRIYKIKKTPKSQSFPILVSKIGQVEQLANIPDSARILIKKFWPGALTIILNSTNNKPGLKSKLGFRMPDSKIVSELIELSGAPIIGTSANLHGKPSPKSFNEIDSALIEMSDGVIEGNCKLMKESTVVDASPEKPVILREGAIKLEADDFNN